LRFIGFFELRFSRYFPPLHPSWCFSHECTNQATNGGMENTPKTKHNDNFSTDGKWRSFPKVPNLLQYFVAGTYYARCQVQGKPVRVSLEASVFTIARRRWPDKLHELRKPKAHIGTFA